ncbi:hypothetical protein KCM76_25645 [Zooshikella marina]|uniref:hypothetical protein n=1 Tax=Zooshikella ganghwensis TaxID=202772 RepID=UPI001BAF1136|nr:hypothetical protein [Zooshikella ganghwensis]MBU2709401.1 hypothetical protein [Zooshikella ganghwensis]
MEEPIRFDVYGKIDTSRKKEAIVYLDELGVYEKNLELRKAVNEATRENRFTILAKSLGYSDAVSFLGSCDWAKELTLVQEMYYPGGEESFCKQHTLHFGGIFGCHVCSGFYKE